MYWLNYLDRNAIALAKLDKIDKDLGLTPTRKWQKMSFRNSAILIVWHRILDLCVHSICRVSNIFET